jgi:hypothetical protein
MEIQDLMEKLRSQKILQRPRWSKVRALFKSAKVVKGARSF